MESSANVTSRAQIWARLVSTALKHHETTQTHGVNTLIAHDCCRANQTVSDWKAGRSPIPAVVTAALASKYGVTVPYLLCLTDNPEYDTSQSHQALKTRMNEMVSNVLDQVGKELPARAVLELCDAALDGLMAEHTTEHIYGSIFMTLMDITSRP